MLWWAYLSCNLCLLASMWTIILFNRGCDICKDKGLVLQARLTGAGAKAPQAASVILFAITENG
jgi:hypothetical protein